MFKQRMSAKVILCLLLRFVGKARRSLSGNDN